MALRLLKTSNDGLIEPIPATEVEEAGWYFLLDLGGGPPYDEADLYYFDPADPCRWRNSRGCGDVTVWEEDLAYGPIKLPEETK